MLTINKVASVMSIHQLDDAEDPKASTVARVCKSSKTRLPTLTYAVSPGVSSMKRVRSFGSFDAAIVPDIDNNSNGDDTSSDHEGSSYSGGNGNGGYVQDVSSFDRLLLAGWEDRFAAGLFRYDVTACQTKVVPGKYGFVAQFNEGRATKKRPTEFAVDKVCQEFDGGKFNFTKADKKEILFCFEAGRVSLDSSEYHAASPLTSDAPTVVFINVSPIEYGHVLLCPRVTEGLPQRIIPAALLPALYMAAESRNPYFRVGYNSLGAYATINHLHFQAYYLMEAFPIERACTGRLPSSVYKKRHRHGSTVNQVLNYPVRCLCFELGDGFESLADLVGTACQRLQARNIPFNLLIADHGARVFLIPQKFSHRAARGEIPEDVAKTGINPAVFEISGHLLYKAEDDYDNVDEEAAVRMLKCASLDEDDFFETVTYMLDEEGHDHDSSHAVAAAPAAVECAAAAVTAGIASDAADASMVSANTAAYTAATAAAATAVAAAAVSAFETFENASSKKIVAAVMLDNGEDDQSVPDVDRRANTSDANASVGVISPSKLQPPTSRRPPRAPLSPPTSPYTASPSSAAPASPSSRSAEDAEEESNHDGEVPDFVPSDEEDGVVPF
mmetsp:Transcript_35757/g.88004  ORF Transcript_35757/g.88004 Transcript_35757/m.88004 type:complete len:615 (-) Transcript_35757:757-2601(-)